jgi:hypothetical protein
MFDEVLAMAKHGVVPTTGRISKRDPNGRKIKTFQPQYLARRNNKQILRLRNFAATALQVWLCRNESREMKE